MTVDPTRTGLPGLLLTVTEVKLGTTKKEENSVNNIIQPHAKDIATCSMTFNVSWWLIISTWRAEGISFSY